MPNNTIEVIQKGQFLRIMDVITIGPAMVGSGFIIKARAKSGLEDIFAIAMIAAGVGTIIYNANNYRLQERALATTSPSDELTPSAQAE